MKINAVIFDLDGVIVSTDEYHYKAWKQLAEEEGIYFDRQINQRLRGVSRMQSLEILLENSKKIYSETEKKELALRKNNYYRRLLKNLAPKDILPGVLDILSCLKQKNIKIAIGSSSKNTSLILEYIGLKDYFNTVIDGNSISRSKPDPEVFLLAALRLHEDPKHCLVVEDAKAGVEAALAGGMKVLAVGFASEDKRATLSAKDLTSISIHEILTK